MKGNGAGREAATRGHRMWSYCREHEQHVSMWLTETGGFDINIEVRTGAKTFHHNLWYITAC